MAAVRAGLPLTTPRLCVRELRADDAAALHSYRSDPEVTRYLGHPPLDPAGVADLVGRWREDPAALTVVAEPAPGHAVGGADLLGAGVVGDVRVRFRPSSALGPVTTSAVDAAIGYAFHPRAQGRGLATECVRAVLHTLASAGVRRVTARVFAPARASSRLLGRVGFTLDGVDRAAVLSPDGATWWDDELWSLLPGPAGELRGRPGRDVR